MHKLFEWKILSATLILGLIKGLMDISSTFIPIILHESGYSTYEVSINIAMFNEARYLICPIIMFILLFKLAERRLMKKISSIIISIMLGSPLGLWIGGLIASVWLSSSTKTSLAATISSLNSSLPYSLPTYILIGFASIAAALINENWDDLLAKSKNYYGQTDRPLGIVIVSILFMVVGILIIFPLLLIIHTISSALIFRGRLITSLSVFLMTIVVAVGYVIIGVGLYRGRRWGWFSALIGTLTGLLVHTGWIISGIFTVQTLLIYILILLLNSIILIYILQPHVREYFRIINPPIR